MNNLFRLTHHISIVQSEKITAPNSHLLIMPFTYVRYLTNQQIKWNLVNESKNKRNEKGNHHYSKAIWYQIYLKIKETQKAKIITIKHNLQRNRIWSCFVSYSLFWLQFKYYFCFYPWSLWYSSTWKGVKLKFLPDNQIKWCPLTRGRISSPTYSITKSSASIGSNATRPQSCIMLRWKRKRFFLAWSNVFINLLALNIH